jgi:hypothetical protein
VLTTRRDLLSLLPLASASAILLSSGSSSSPQYAEAQEASSPVVSDQSTYDFWTQDIRNPESSGARTRSLGAAPRASFVYFDEHAGFVTGSDIGDDGLKDTGDVDVIVNVDHVRPSVADQARFLNLEGASLRIDLQQGIPLPGLAERLAWTAIAGFLPENKTLPALKEMTFDPGSAWGKLQSVPLPGGFGRWTWNFFLQRRKSRWMQIFDVIRKAQGLATPIFGLGFPAIATTALNTVDSIVGELTKDERTEWLFQSPDVSFYATKKARDAFEGSKLRLKKGMYVIMPSDKLSAFAKEQSGLVVKDGLIVPKNTSSLEVEAAAKETIKDITYLTVGVTTKFRPAAK